MSASDNKLWFTERYPFNEFSAMVEKFVGNAQALTRQGSTKGFKQSYQFDSGFSLQNRYGMGAPSKVMYINWHVVNIYYHIEVRKLYIAIQDTAEREIQSKQISDHEKLIEGSKVIDLPGKGSAYTYLEISDSLSDQDMDNLYTSFIDLCSEVSSVIPDVELKKWNFGDSKPGYVVKRLTHEDRLEMRKGLTSQLRVKILVRDKSTCQICRKTPKDGVSLHVDHIHPISRGGTNNPTNLRVLCSTCNTSKNARLV